MNCNASSLAMVLTLGDDFKESDVPLYVKRMNKKIDDISKKYSGILSEESINELVVANWSKGTYLED